MHIITGLKTGGAEMMLYKLLSGMNRQKFDQVVVSLMDRGALGGRIESLGIPVYSVGMRRALPMPQQIAQLVSLRRKIAPDIIQGWMYHGNFAAQICSMGATKKIPVIWNIRGTHTDLKDEKPLTAFLVWLEGKLSALPAAIINNSAASAASHQQKLGYRADKWRIIPNGFDVELFKPSTEAKASLCSELGLPPDALLIGLVGRFHPVKDHDTFLRAVALVADESKNVHFVVVGDGLDSANRELTHLIAQLNLQDSVHLLGKRSDLPYLTAALDIACSSSTAEGFPNVIGEAMSCGVPCVVTDVGDSAWIVGDTGRVVPPRDPAAFAHALRELTGMPPDRRHALGKAARKRVIELFSLDHVVGQYEALYNEIYESVKGK